MVACRAICILLQEKYVACETRFGVSNSTNAVKSFRFYAVLNAMILYVSRIEKKLKLNSNFCFLSLTREAMKLLRETSPLPHIAYAATVTHFSAKSSACQKPYDVVHVNMNHVWMSNLWAHPVQVSWFVSSVRVVMNLNYWTYCIVVPRLGMWSCISTPYTSSYRGACN